MRKSVIWAGVSLLTFFAVGSTMLYKTNNINAYAESNYSEITVSNEKDLSVDNSISNIANPEQIKNMVYNKMLNTVDYFNSAEGSFVTNLIDMESESEVNFITNISQEASYESANDIETFWRGNQVSTYNNMARTALILNCGEYVNDETRLSGESRIEIESDGSKNYYYRYNSTNLPYAKLALLPQEMTFGLLSDFTLWSAFENVEYLGRTCVSISGVTTEEYCKRLNTVNFEMYVDESTGIILKYEGFSDNGDLSTYIHMKDIKIDFNSARTYGNNVEMIFDEEKYAEYTDLVKEFHEARQKKFEQNLNAEE